MWAEQQSFPPPCCIIHGLVPPCSLHRTCCTGNREGTDISQGQMTPFRANNILGPEVVLKASSYSFKNWLSLVWLKAIICQEFCKELRYLRDHGGGKQWYWIPLKETNSHQTGAQIQTEPRMPPDQCKTLLQLQGQHRSSWVSATGVRGEFNSKFCNHLSHNPLKRGTCMRFETVNLDS